MAIASSLRILSSSGGCVEAQAEPWESSRDTYSDPASFTPEDVKAVHGRLVHAGCTSILLWGCEYRLWRAAAGDRRWLEAAGHLLGEMRV